MAYKVFQNGFPLNASELNNYLMNQSVMVFATATARDTDLTAPLEGMIVWLQDSNKFVYYTGTAWADVDSTYESGNAIINGALDIWQRGTSQTISTLGSPVFLADRWGVTGGGSGTINISRQSITPGDLPLNDNYFYRFNIATVGTISSCYVFQQIEDVTKFAGQTVTISFYAKADSARTLTTQFAQNFGTGGSSYNGSLGVTNYSLTTAWKRFTLTYQVPSITGKTIGTNSSFDFFFNFGSTLASGATIDIRAVQLEAGLVATPFKTNAPSKALELVNCQKDYYRWIANDAYGQIGSGNATSGTLSITLVKLPVTMRTAPTSIDYGSLSTYGLHDQVNSAVALTSLTLGRTNADTPLLNAGVASGLTQYRNYNLGANNNTGAYIGFATGW